MRRPKLSKEKVKRLMKKNNRWGSEGREMVYKAIGFVLHRRRVKLDTLVNLMLCHFIKGPVLKIIIPCNILVPCVKKKIKLLHDFSIKA